MPPTQNEKRKTLSRKKLFLGIKTSISSPKLWFSPTTTFENAIRFAIRMRFSIGENILNPDQSLFWNGNILGQLASDNCKKIRNKVSTVAAGLFYSENKTESRNIFDPKCDRSKR